MFGFKKTLLSAAILAVLAPASQAQVIEEIVVTATKRESSVRDVPFSVNAQSEEDIRRQNASSLEDVARSVAGLSIQNLGPGQSQVAIRGVSAGQIVRDQPGVKEQVGVYIDETVMSLSLFTPDLDLFDLNRVETLRGPQGTLFGSGSIGGTIRYITNQPKIGVEEGTVEVNLHSVHDGDTGGHLKGALNLPINDKAALRVVGYGTAYGDYIDAQRETGTEEDINSGGRYGGRVSLLWQPSDNLTITPRIIYQDIESEAFNRQEIFSIFANPFTTTRPPFVFNDRQQFLLLDEAFEDETLIADVVVNWSLNNFDVTYVGSYIDREILVSRDASALSGSVSVDLGFPEAAVLLPSNLRDTTDLDQSTHEIRLSSNGDGPLQWVGGLFYSDTDRVYAQRLPTPGYDAFTDATLGAGTAASVSNGFPADSPFNSDLPYTIEQIAIFGEVTYAINERFDVTIGGRWYDWEEERTITTGGLFANGDVGVVDATDSNGFTPRIMASYDINNQVTLNAQASQGFRLGGVNDPLNVPLCNEQDLAVFGGFQSYEDETLWNYEVGVKTFFDRMTLNASVFYTDIEDLQVTLDAGSCSSRVSFNVPEAHTVGAELELNALVTDAFEITFAGGIQEAEFDSTVTDSTGAVVGGVEDGNRLASVPEWQFSLSGIYTFGSLLGANSSYVSASWQMVGDRITQPSDQTPGAGVFQSGLPFAGATGEEVTVVDLELDDYSIVNLSAGLEYEEHDVIFYINNLTDENALLSFDRERGGRARLGYRVGQPRTYGVTYRWRF